ncbi:Bacterial regulatory protein, tetR family [anaerobic digester metagenome]
MSRKAVLEGGKRDEILNAALELFLRNGYEATSIRMILEHVNGEVGMFYHYFNSKQEVFDKSVEFFFKKSGEKFSAIVTNYTTPRFMLEQLYDCYASSMEELSQLANGSIHWSILYALHDQTLEAMLPAFQSMIHGLLQAAGNDDGYGKEYLASFLLKGISGLVHDKTFFALPPEIRVQETMELICRTLQIPYDILED